MTGIEKITTAVNEMLQTALGVSLLDMFIQIMATILLVIIVKKFFWGKITTFLEKRGEILNQEFATIEQAKTQALDLERLRQEEYTALQKQKSDLLLEAKRIAEAEKAGILAQAKDEASRLKEEMQRQLDYDVLKAKEALSHEVVSLAAELAKKMIEKEIDPLKYTESLGQDFAKRKS